MHVVVMGVSGCGKSTVGRALAGRLGVPFIEGDELHPAENVARMRAGIPLTDADRAGWLEEVAGALAAQPAAVVSCSALKRAYRDRLRRAAPALRLVHLQGAPETLQARLAARVDHYMPASLLQSQLDALEPPADDEGAIRLDIGAHPQAIVDAAFDALTRPRLRA